MVVVLILFAVGAVGGYFLRNIKRIQRFTEYFTKLALIGMLFLLGVNVGKNDEIMGNLATIGWQAGVLTLGAVGGSVLAAWLVYAMLFRTEKTQRHER